MTTTVERMTGDERREQLIQVAISLFAKKGFTGTTTKEIALGAGVTEALIFKYFPTKDALYDAILRSKVDECEIEEYLASLAEYVERRDDFGLFRAVIASIIQFHRENPEFQRLMLYSGLEGHNLAQNFREQLVRPIHTYLEEYIRLRQSEGAFGAINPAAAVFAVVAMPLHHLLVSNITNCPVVRLEDEEAADQFTQIAVRGLLAR